MLSLQTSPGDSFHTALHLPSPGALWRCVSVRIRETGLRSRKPVSILPTWQFWSLHLAQQLILRQQSEVLNYKRKKVTPNSMDFRLEEWAQPDNPQVVLVWSQGSKLSILLQEPKQEPSGLWTCGVSISQVTHIHTHTPVSAAGQPHFSCTSNTPIFCAFLNCPQQRHLN